MEEMLFFLANMKNGLDSVEQKAVAKITLNIGHPNTLPYISYNLYMPILPPDVSKTCCANCIILFKLLTEIGLLCLLD